MCCQPLPARADPPLRAARSPACLPAPPLQDKAAIHLMQRFGAAPADCAFMCGELRARRAPTPTAAAPLSPALLLLLLRPPLLTQAPQAAAHLKVNFIVHLLAALSCLPPARLQTTTTTCSWLIWWAGRTCQPSQQTVWPRQWRQPRSTSMLRSSGGCLLLRRCCACWWRSRWGTSQLLQLLWPSTRLWLGEDLRLGVGSTHCM